MDAALLRQVNKAADALAVVDERRRDARTNECTARRLLRGARATLACAPQEVRRELLREIAKLEALLRVTREDLRRLDELEREACACLAHGAREMGRMWSEPQPHVMLSIPR